MKMLIKDNEIKKCREGNEENLDIFRKCLRVYDYQDKARRDRKELTCEKKKATTNKK